MAGKSHLTDISAEDRMLLYSLPYRVGIWMSHADDEEGEEDDIKELKTLEKNISLLSKNENLPPFVQEILSQTISHKDQWESWKAKAFDILGDCEKAVVLLEKNVSQEDRKAYKKILVNLATRVAGAHGEFGEHLEEENVFHTMWDKLVKKVKGESEGDFVNISAAEDAALQRLTVALQPSNKE